MRVSALSGSSTRMLETRRWRTQGSEQKHGACNPDLLAFLSLTVLLFCSIYVETTCLYFIAVLLLSLGLIEKKKKKAVDAMEK